ncbi:MAG: dTDP-4-dehydrorhamnose reductase [Phycisphaerales bacterium JB040]
MPPPPPPSATQDDHAPPGGSEARFLILGCEGMLGRAWRELLASRRIAHDGVDRRHGDLTDPADVQRLLTPAHTHVINCAAWTDVDGAEQREAEATRVNADAVVLLASRCADTHAVLVHYSTDYVFNGRAETPYETDHPRDPVNAYGRSKAAGETALESSSADWLCLRTSWLYAPWGNNFVRTIARLARERDELKVVSDQRGRPTSAQGLARTTLALLDAGARGMHHATDGGACTWHDFATAIASRANPACAVHPCTSREFPRPAPRPAYSVLDLSGAETLIGPMTPWRDALSGVLDEMERTETTGESNG